jgi:hypothetical protein
MTESGDPRPGFEVMDVDLDRVPTVEQGLADATDRYRAFAALAGESISATQDKILFLDHLPLLSFINRAASLHAGVVSAVKESNPHAAFTLLRAYLELVVLVRWVDLHPEYIEALKRPMSELPKNTRKRWDELFADAATEMPGVRAVYATLSEMAHFGSTALWHPFTVGDDEEERRLSYGTGPHWKGEDDARIVLAMLIEADEAVMVVLRRFWSHHLAPVVDAYVAREADAGRIVKALGGTRVEASAENLGPAMTVPGEVARDALADGVVVWCDEHQAIELAEGVTPETVETWAAGREPQPLPRCASGSSPSSRPSGSRTCRGRWPRSSATSSKSRSASRRSHRSR